jgi:hypothetical protein
LVAGLLVAVGFLSALPVSRSFSDRTCQFIGSVLFRAEAAARCLVIVQARMIAAQSGRTIDRRSISEALSRAMAMSEAEVSLLTSHRRLKALRVMLSDLPRHALRLLHRIEKHQKRTGRACRVSPRPEVVLAVSLRDLRLAGTRIERPPDQSFLTGILMTLPRFPGGRRSPLERGVLTPRANAC